MSNEITDKDLAIIAALFLSLSHEAQNKELDNIKKKDLTLAEYLELAKEHRAHKKTS